MVVGMCCLNLADLPAATAAANGYPLSTFVAATMMPPYTSGPCHPADAAEPTPCANKVLIQQVNIMSFFSCL